MDRIASPQQLQRLHEIARDLGAELTEDTLPLSPPRQRPTFKVPDDDRKADAVLGQSRIELSQVQSRPKGLRRAFSTTKLSGSHSYEEIYIALTRVIEENDLIGVAEVLLDRFRQLGGDINVARRASTGLIKKIRNADSPEERGHLLESATDKGRVDAVQLFAPDADQPSLNESLRIALQRKNLAITEVLLQYGANASVHQQIFQKAASNGEVELLKLMLRAPQRIPEHCVTRSLLHATANGSLLAVQLLVTAGAKGDHDGAAAFINAVEMDRIDLVAAILVGPSPPSPVSIDLGLKTALAARSNNFMERYNIIELLLCAGPFGHAKDEGLVKATLFANLELIQLFLWYQADINYHGGSAIASAIQRNRADIFGILLQEQGLKTEVASELVASISRIGPSAERLSLLEKLLAKGASGVYCNELLITAASQGDLKISKLLLTYGKEHNSEPVVSVDYNAARALQIGVSHGKVEMVKLLALEGKPSASSLSRAFDSMPELKGNEQYLMLQTLLRAGARGPEVDAALKAAVASPGTSRRVLEILVKYGARVDHEMLLTSISQGNADLTQVLLGAEAPSTHDATAVTGRTAVPVEFCTAALDVSTKLPIGQPRYKINKYLLERIAVTGKEYPEVAKAVAYLVQQSPADIKLLRLFCHEGKANINWENGLVVVLAIQRGSPLMLDTLLQSGGGPPSMATISRALKTAIDLPITDKYRPYKVEALLRGVKPQEALDEALIEEVKASLILNRENTVIATLLAAGADVNAQEAAAIRHALHQPSILDLLLAKQASPASLAMAMPLAMSIPEPDRLVICEKLIQAGAGGEEINKTLSKAVEEGPSALPVMRLVLPKANHDYDGGSALHLAVQHGFVDGLDLLLPHFVKTSPAMKSAVLQEAISIKNKKCRYLMTQKLTETEIPATILAECVSTAVGIQDVAIMELLLAKGAAGEPVTQALIDAIEGCAQEDENPAKLIDIILRFDVDINYKGGLALQKAVQKLNLEIIQKLLPGSNSYSKAMAIPYLFKATSDKATVLQTIEAFSDSILDSEEALDISFKHPDHGLEPVLFMALSHFPRRTQILRALLDLGYNPNQWGLYEVSSKVGPEPWPVLCWAISQPEKRISSANIELLIEEGANVDFTSKSGINPVMLSIQNHRPDVLAALIEKGAKIRVSDDDGVSPLALASQLGNTRVMEHLLVAGADIDDGSLHDAARDLRIDAMRMLVKHGHDVDYPSERHDGRSALAELCLHAVDKGSRSQLEEATQFLIASGSDFRICGVSDEHSGKTIFHYAMDSSDPLKVLQVLLKLPLWKVINDDSFLFKDATYTYSLTKYVEKGLCLGPQSQKEDIVKLLRHKRAQDKFWAHSLDTAQPTDYCGAPKYIDEEVVRQKARQKRLLEEREDAMVAVALKRDTVIEEGKIKIIQTNQEIKRDMEKSRAEVHLLEVKADTELRLHTRAENERQRLARNVQANELTHLKARGTIEAANQRAIRHAEIEEDATRNLMQLEYEDTRISKDNEGVRARMAIEGIAREDQERSQQRHHDRDLARMKMQANILDKSTRLAGQLQGAGMNQRQIGYVVGEV